MAEKVFVAMSGGVDSSVAAYLLKQQGFDVVGITMLICGDNDNNAAVEAARVAEALKIRHYVFDLTKEFDDLVIEPFVNEYKNGRTPNPCVICNKHVKWGILLEKSIQMGADYFGTGHYAKTVKVGNRLSLLRTGEKDQSYALYKLTQRHLEKTIFPLHSLEKNQVRSIAEKAGLLVFDKPDSQDICFIKDGKHGAFIEERTGLREAKGEFVLSNGEVLGEHNGISNYTIGQRKGLGISYKEPLFVNRIDSFSNRVILGSNEELFSSEFIVGNTNYMGVSIIESETRCIGKVRYAHKGEECIIKPFDSSGDKLFCRFLEPQRAITPGQSAVFYLDNTIIAGGIIEGC